MYLLKLEKMRVEDEGVLEVECKILSFQNAINFVALSPFVLW